MRRPVRVPARAPSAPPTRAAARGALLPIALIAAGLPVAAGCRTDRDGDEPAPPSTEARSTDTTALAERRREVAARGALVMPFDLERTTHVFTPTSSGGVQTVVADDPADREQVGLVRAHVREEAVRFARGDFADPAAIHGEEMPGLAELRAGASRIEVEYEDVTAGGRIRYATTDAGLVRALHAWFAAQRSDHGAHAEDR